MILLVLKTGGEEWAVRNRRNMKVVQNGGFSLIEVLACVAVMSIVFLMTVRIVGGAVNLHRRAAAISELQREGLFIARRLENAIMSAEGICIDETEQEAVLFTREISEENGIRTGCGFRYDRSSGCLYQHDEEEDYLISDKITDLSFYVEPGSSMVGFDIFLQDPDSGGYEIRSGAVPRNFRYE